MPACAAASSPLLPVFRLSSPRLTSSVEEAKNDDGCKWRESGEREADDEESEEGRKEGEANHKRKRIFDALALVIKIPFAPENMHSMDIERHTYIE